jgi:hypothetical protein
VSTLAGGVDDGLSDGVGTAARFSHPTGIAYGGRSGGDALYVADQANHCLRVVSVSDGLTVTLAGCAKTGYVDDAAPTARLFRPSSVAMGGPGELFVTDKYNHAIRRVDGLLTATGDGGGVRNVHTVAGKGKTGGGDGNSMTATFNQPVDLLFDAAAAAILVLDQTNMRIRRVALGKPDATTGVGLDAQASASASAPMSLPAAASADATGAATASAASTDTTTAAPAAAVAGTSAPTTAAVSAAAALPPVAPALAVGTAGAGAGAKGKKKKRRTATAAPNAAVIPVVPTSNTTAASAAASATALEYHPSRTHFLLDTHPPALCSVRSFPP